MQAVAAQIVDEGLAPLRDMLAEMTLVGGASIGMWLDAGAPPARQTNDIDLVVMCRTRVQYYAVAERLRARGLAEDPTSSVLCRWVSRSGTIIDVMPVEQDVLGFSNAWYLDAFEEAEPVVLPSGATLPVATTPYLLATKFDAFDSPHRADGGDHLASADMHDVVALIDGRTDLERDFASVRPAVRKHVRRRISQPSETQIGLALLNYLPPDSSAAQRERRIRTRIAWIAALNDT